MLDQNSFEITLFIFVIIFSGIFYLPINIWEYKQAEKRNLIINKKLLKRKKILDKKRKIIKAVKNLTKTSGLLSDNLQGKQINP